MILNVGERVLLLSILPKEGSYATMKILGELRMNLSYTEEELKKWGIETNMEAQTIKWEEDGEADIPVGEKATGIIMDALRKLDKENKLAQTMVPIYEKFIPTIE